MGRLLEQRRRCHRHQQLLHRVPADIARECAIVVGADPAAAVRHLHPAAWRANHRAQSGRRHFQLAAAAKRLVSFFLFELGGTGEKCFFATV